MFGIIVPIKIGGSPTFGSPIKGSSWEWQWSLMVHSVCFIMVDRDWSLISSDWQWLIAPKVFLIDGLQNLTSRASDKPINLATWWPFGRAKSSCVNLPYVEVPEVTYTSRYRDTMDEQTNVWNIGTLPDVRWFQRSSSLMLGLLYCVLQCRTTRRLLTLHQ